MQSVFSIFSFSLTLIDTLDTLVVSYSSPLLQPSLYQQSASCTLIHSFGDSHVLWVFPAFFSHADNFSGPSQVLGEVEEFEKAAKLVINDVTFDNDIVVSVFETNIRVLG